MRQPEPGSHVRDPDKPGAKGLVDPSFPVRSIRQGQDGIRVRVNDERRGKKGVKQRLNTGPG